MPKPFKALKIKMYAEEVDQVAMCKTMGRSRTYLTRRMSAIEPFSASDMLEFKKALRITSREEFLDLFFPGENWEASL